MRHTDRGRRAAGGVSLRGLDRVGHSRNSRPSRSGAPCRTTRRPHVFPDGEVRRPVCQVSRSPGWPPGRSLRSASSTRPSRRSTARTRCGWPCRTAMSSRPCSPTRLGTAPRPLPAHRRRSGVGERGHLHLPSAICRADQRRRRHARWVGARNRPKAADPRGRSGDAPEGQRRPCRALRVRGRAVNPSRVERLGSLGMPVYDFDPPARFVAGTVGPPGQRTFFLQARDRATPGQRVLREGATRHARRPALDVLDDCGPGPAGSDAARRHMPTTSPLDTPIEDEFRVTTMSLGWDPDRRGGLDRGRCRRVGPDPAAEADDSAEEAEDQPDAVAESLRVTLPPAQARAFARRAQRPDLGGSPTRARSAGGRWTRPGMSAPERTATDAERRVGGGIPDGSDHARATRAGRRLSTKRCGPPRCTLEMVGRITDASNLALLARCCRRMALRRRCRPRLRASTNPCAASGRSGTSRRAPWPGARWPQRCSPKPPGVCRRPAHRAARRTVGGRVGATVDR
jgi:uncharacterized repeat protein (TIGR03847 family)